MPHPQSVSTSGSPHGENREVIAGVQLKILFDPDLVAPIQAEIAAGEKTVSATKREAGTSLKSAWRGQFTGAGLGTRPANRIRRASFPKSRVSLNTAALAGSDAPVIIGAHDTGGR